MVTLPLLFCKLYCSFRTLLNGSVQRNRCRVTFFILLYVQYLFSVVQKAPVRALICSYLLQCCYSIPLSDIAGDLLATVGGKVNEV